MEPLSVCFINCCRNLRNFGKGKAFYSLQTRSYSISHKVLEGKASNEPPFLMAHGLMGNKNNFNSLSKWLNEKTGRKVITYDARNHGSSGHCDTMTLEEMRDDAIGILDLLNIKKCIFLGHSMGGRVALFTALTEPERIDKLIVVDSSPSLSTSIRVAGSTLHYVEAMEDVEWKNAVSLSDARRSAEGQLKGNITDEAVRNFLLTNIQEVKRGKFGWRVNLAAIRNHVEEPSRVQLLKHELTPFRGSSLFLGGGNSNFITPDDYPDIKALFPNSTISHIPGSGHWVHSDKPLELVADVANFLNPEKRPLF